jgi:hypothetical protein
MPSTLVDRQHEICALDGTSVLLFGTEATGYQTATRPTIGAGDLRTGDVDRPAEDGIMFGRDYGGAKTVTFEISVLADLTSVAPELDNLDLLAAIEDVWTDPRWRAAPTAMAMLRTREAGRTSRCYGRPRRYAEAAGTLTRQGYTPVVADFALIDDRWYSDDLSQESASLIQPPDGGLVAPLVAPLTTIPEMSADTIAEVGGTRATWPVVTFNGPCTNPRVTIGDLTIGLRASFASDRSVTVDPRPWQRTVLRDDGADLAGYLSAATPALRNCQLDPGSYGITYYAVDGTGTSTCTVAWRDARARP